MTKQSNEEKHRSIVEISHVRSRGVSWSWKGAHWREHLQLETRRCCGHGWTSVQTVYTSRQKGGKEEDAGVMVKLSWGYAPVTDIQGLCNAILSAPGHQVCPLTAYVCRLPGPSLSPRALPSSSPPRNPTE